MGDRRQGDRRDPEKGIIKISFRTAIFSIILTIIFLISFSANIILAQKYSLYRKAYESYIDYENDFDEDYQENFEEENSEDYNID